MTPDPDELKKAQRAALKYLSYRDRSEFEIKERLDGKGFSGDAIEETIFRLTQLGYLSDERFALNWSRRLVSEKKFGAHRLRDELSAKGLAAGIIERTLRVVYSETNEGNLARTLARKKLSLLKGVDPKSKSRRLAQYLQRKGFPSDTVFETVKQLIPNNADHEFPSSQPHLPVENPA